jgi:site-specific DNA-cytosine methylase
MIAAKITTRQLAYSFYEFFAGGGMVRAGLGPMWTCLFANDFDHKKVNLMNRIGELARLRLPM